MTTSRLAAQDWIDFAMKAMAREGAGVLKADVLAKKLGVTRGSFYWHFADLDAFHARVIAAWREAATEAVIGDLEREATPGARLEALLRRALSRRGTLEVRMRHWAETSTAAARALDAIDQRRISYIEDLLITGGVTRSVAQTRALLLYWTFLGAALSRTRLPPDETEGLLRVLLDVAWSDAAPKRKPVAKR